jgi:hypothetical protein
VDGQEPVSKEGLEMTVITQQRAIPGETPVAGLSFVSLLVAGAGVLFGLAAFVAVVVGDAAIPMGNAAVISAALVVVGLIGVVIVRDLPGIAAIGMAAVPVGLYVALGEKLGTWADAFQAAVVTRGAAELALWASMAAMSLFVISAILFGFGAVVAAFSWNERQ